MQLFLYLQELNNKYKVVKPKKATYKKQKDKGGNNESQRINKGTKKGKNQRTTNTDKGNKALGFELV